MALYFTLLILEHCCPKTCTERAYWLLTGVSFVKGKMAFLRGVC